MLVAEEEESWKLDFVGESVALVSKAVVVASGSVVDGSVAVGRGSKDNVGLICRVEVAVVFCTAESGGEEDSTTGEGTDTVIYVVDVIVTVPKFWSPNVQKDVGALLIRLLHGVEVVSSLSADSALLG